MAVEGATVTGVAEFLLLGLSGNRKQQQLLLILFLSLSLVTGLGNLFIVLAIATDSQLHTPTFLLMAMAYDRYAAICHPLHYAVSVMPHLCGLLVAASWTAAFRNALTHTVLLTRLLFCTHNRVPHLFCDLSPLLKLACSDTFLNNAMLYTGGTLPIITPFVGILVSYTCIFASVLRIPSTRGKQKAFSTCGSHLSVVSLSYGTLIGVYFSPTSSHTAQKDTAAAVMYVMVTPMLNPFMYSLCNSDRKGALGALIGREPVFIQ
ncbi:olfactory receptor 1f1 [Lynx pardinus]|uniref:Olfactory receptor 1f1 n=1 Tax=Lynx pardinus TaxID=191816 RepID=A0A485PMS2_LYNPA|nr:olfactory receptor 1f1 [Lynx pardinus]